MLVAGALLLIAHPSFAAGRANYIEVASWDTGYQAQYTISNDGPGDIPRWAVTFDLPSGSRISSSWDSVISTSGQHLAFNNASWNGNLTPGTSTTFGFVVVGLGRPVACKINGGPCDTFAPLAALDHHAVGSGGEDAAPSIAVAAGADTWREQASLVALARTTRGRYTNRKLRRKLHQSRSMKNRVRQVPIFLCSPSRISAGR